MITETMHDGVSKRCKKPGRSTVRLSLSFIPYALSTNNLRFDASYASAQQIVEAFPEDKAPRFLIRDRDSIYGEFFRQRIKHMGIEEVVIAYRSPWQNPFAERLIGSIRRECLDHFIVLNERHLSRILRTYFDYYHHVRAHLSLDRNSPVARDVEPPDRGQVIAIPQVGGLHHRYRRTA